MTDKYLIIDTWNGEGYSESNAEIVSFTDINKAKAYTKKRAEDCTNNKVTFINDDYGMRYEYSVGEDDGAMHLFKVSQKPLAVKLVPMINSFELIFCKQKLNSIIEDIKNLSFEYKDEPIIFKACHQSIKDEDLILFSYEDLEKESNLLLPISEKTSLTSIC